MPRNALRRRPSSHHAPRPGRRRSGKGRSPGKGRSGGSARIRTAEAQPFRPADADRGGHAALLGLLFLLFAFAASSATAQDTTRAEAAGDAARQAEPFSGTFMYDPDAGDDMEEVVDEGVSLVESWLKRQFARGRIRETNRPYDFIQIFPREDTVTVNTEQWSLDVPRQGTLEDWERAEDDLVDVQMEWTGDAWVQTFEASDGVRINRYTLGPEGDTMTMHVTLTSDQLEKPLKYELVYDKR